MEEQSVCGAHKDEQGELRRVVALQEEGRLWEPRVGGCRWGWLYMLYMPARLSESVVVRSMRGGGGGSRETKSERGAQSEWEKENDAPLQRRTSASGRCDTTFNRIPLVRICLSVAHPKTCTFCLVYTSSLDTPSLITTGTLQHCNVHMYELHTTAFMRHLSL